MFRGDAAAARETYLTCAEIARDAEDPSHRSMGLKYAVWIAGELADFSAMRPMVAEFIAVADELGAAYDSAGSRVLAANTAYFLGDIAEALDLIYAACAQGVPSALMRMNLAVYGTPIALAANDPLLLSAWRLWICSRRRWREEPSRRCRALCRRADRTRRASRCGRTAPAAGRLAMKAVPATVYRDGLLFSLARYADADRLDDVAELMRSRDGVGLAAIYRSLARATLAKRGNDPATVT